MLGREQQQQQPPDPSAPPEWLAGLTRDELKADKSLLNFKSLDDLAAGYIETKKVATGKVTLPKEGDAESFARFAAAIRPEAADKYTIDLPEGADSGFADAMRPAFFDAGLHPQQVEMLVKANNDFAAMAKQQAEQKGRDELDALAAEMGAQEFERGKQAAVNMLNRLGIPADFENDLARFHGGGNTLRMLFALAEKTGELGRVDATDVSLALGNLKGEAAMAEARRMQRDPVIGPKLADEGSPERKRYDELVKAASPEAG